MNPDLARAVRALIEEAMSTDGAHHKQWFLAQLADVLGVSLDDDVDRGTPP